MPAEDSRLCFGQAAGLTLSEGMLSCAIAASVRLCIHLEAQVHSSAEADLKQWLGMLAQTD